MAGINVLHLHWISGQFAPRRNLPGILKTYLFYSYRLFLRLCQLLRIRVVWTAHNFLPHEPVFADDLAARQILVRHSNAIVAFTPEMKARLVQQFQATDVEIIPAAEPIPAPSELREVTREKLGVPAGLDNFVALGHIRNYKGPDLFLAAALQAPNAGHFTLAGAPSESEFMQEIYRLTEIADKKLQSSHFEIGFLADTEFANILQSADFLVCPFRNISNSGIVNMGMTFGIPLILPRLEQLNWVPNDAAIWYEPSDPIVALSAALEKAKRLSKSEREKLSKAGTDFMRSRTWDSYVQAIVDLYRRLLD